jgi:hypothetical protein
MRGGGGDLIGSLGPLSGLCSSSLLFGPGLSYWALVTMSFTFDWSVRIFNPNSGNYGLFERK